MKTKHPLHKMINRILHDALKFSHENPDQKFTSTVINNRPDEIKILSDVFKTKMQVDTETKTCFIEYQPYENGMVNIRLESFELDDCLIQAFLPVNNMPEGRLFPVQESVLTTLMASKAVQYSKYIN